MEALGVAHSVLFSTHVCAAAWLPPHGAMYAEPPSAAG